MKNSESEIIKNDENGITVVLAPDTSTAREDGPGCEVWAEKTEGITGACGAAFFKCHLNIAKDSHAANILLEAVNDITSRAVGENPVKQRLIDGDSLDDERKAGHWVLDTGAPKPFAVSGVEVGDDAFGERKVHHAILRIELREWPDETFIMVSLQALHLLGTTAEPLPQERYGGHDDLDGQSEGVTFGG